MLRQLCQKTKQICSTDMCDSSWIPWQEQAVVLVNTDMWNSSWIPQQEQTVVLMVTKRWEAWACQTIEFWQPSQPASFWVMFMEAAMVARTAWVDMTKYYRKRPVLFNQHCIGSQGAMNRSFYNSGSHASVGGNRMRGMASMSSMSGRWRIIIDPDQWLLVNICVVNKTYG